MRLLRLIVKADRRDMAAHAIILTTVRILSVGNKPHATKKEAPQRAIKTLGSTAPTTWSLTKPIGSVLS